jgi:hypothetical protein
MKNWFKKDKKNNEEEEPQRMSKRDSFKKISSLFTKTVKK